MVTARQQYDERPVLASDLDFTNDKGLTKQSDARDTDINLIFKRFEKTGQLPDMIARQPRYGDFSNVPDYQQALNIVRHAEEQFNNLGVEIRNRFDNDPAKFLAFATDDKNADELEKLGLLKPEAVERRKKEREAQMAKELEPFNKAQEEKKKAERAALIADVVKAVKGL